MGGGSDLRGGFVDEKLKWREQIWCRFFTARDPISGSGLPNFFLFEDKKNRKRLNLRALFDSFYCIIFLIIFSA